MEATPLNGRCRAEAVEYVLMINCDNEYEYCLCVKGASFSRLNELMNDLYDNGKIDLSTDSNIEIFAFPKAFEGVSMGDLFDGSGLGKRRGVSAGHQG